MTDTLTDRTPDAVPSAAPVLSVRDLSVSIGTRRGVARVVNGVSYDVRAGQTLAIVGESGSGKTVAALAVMRLLDPPAKVSGEVLLDGVDLLKASERQLCRIRGNRIAMIFQDPMTSLNPVKTIGSQLIEPLQLHQRTTGSAARDRAAELLDLVGIPAARHRLDDYPHHFSGGMRQRVMIAMALACEPRVLLADEATTALDVTTQAQIIDLVAGLQQRLGLAVVWITHDLGVVAGIADRVAVMYAGRILEEGPVDAVYGAPGHPYTIGLLAAVPRVGAERPRRLRTIPGLPPDPVALPPGCPFWPRCEYREDARAATEVPPARLVGPDHRVACFYDVEDGRHDAAHD
ncbi:ABC transporter ATP-binding protein [Solwaraspora sp. WMMD406]|uniref:ABC transporter ATP-binding protein n=1 Tax=Solwaraspora sp. WMMD406 TaxID=3016095 RepID=UPI002417D1F3|nr:ABC transporter ATP-binding protein [Solwaraspora sp. WMMD406]MDG4766748.1 ABC transporter ATP-binding protein [Solwaraspora sp. WMMD406]